jgi:formylglycine-generating enzyme required for sulfatase activity
MVTHHHFTDFLNEVKQSLTVENGIVKHKNDIWFYLGEGAESDAPIIFKDGRFILPDAAIAAKPVTRVTWYGASAYARHYGKRLLTETEWAYGVSKLLISSRKVNHFQADNDTTSPGRQMHNHMMDMNDEFNAGKDQSLSPASIVSGGNYKEWVTRQRLGQENVYKDTSEENIFYPSMVAATSQHPGQPFKNFRYPWEAFSDVGFRCAVSPGNEN